ncbi:hypothetical protein PoB_000169900 [Plakobranchus ocellatus]|uniref:Uncharacterized protein n=1 Tax=Plakobranchus ocellatus TaxID=259542 RepID=A0AAV3XWE5_9GAST|nr:hypothetical protein PoB_000169900 [Plakobranchus ocellatus]
MPKGSLQIPGQIHYPLVTIASEIVRELLVACRRWRARSRGSKNLETYKLLHNSVPTDVAAKTNRKYLGLVSNILVYSFVEFKTCSYLF